MKIKFAKSGRIADTEIIITCSTSVSSPIAAIEINDFVKEATIRLAKDVKEFTTGLKEREKNDKRVHEKAIPVMESIGKALGAETEEEAEKEKEKS